MQARRTYNWGIIGSGRISSDFVKALINSRRSKVVACSDYKPEAALQFAKQFDITLRNAYDSDRKVSTNPNVDIVHVGSINLMHFQAVLFALKNKKHVLCEVGLIHTHFHLIYLSEFQISNQPQNMYILRDLRLILRSIVLWIRNGVV